MTKAIVKKQSAALVNWDEKLAGYAQEASDSEQALGSFISFKSGQLTVAGQPVKGNEADVIVLDSIYENKMYQGKFDSENKAPPVCYAFARTQESLKPHEKSFDKKHEQCAGCPYNEFGTADTGKGKACKNTRRLGVLAIGNAETTETIKNREVFFAELPVTSVKGWAGYVKSVAAVLKRPPFGVVTKLSVIPDAKTQFKVVFSDPRPIPSELLESVMFKVDEVKNSIVFPYPDPKPEEEKPAAGKKRKF
jgi:hypothetical protein